MDSRVSVLPHLKGARSRFFPKVCIWQTTRRVFFLLESRGERRVARRARRLSFWCPNLGFGNAQVQVYHDARYAVVESRRSISCPQTLRQRAAVERLLARTETIYSESRSDGKWHRHVRFQRKERGVGVPRQLPRTLEPTDPRGKHAFQQQQRARRAKHLPRQDHDHDHDERLRTAHATQQRQEPRFKQVAKPTMRTPAPQKSLPSF